MSHIITSTEINDRIGYIIPLIIKESLDQKLREFPVKQVGKIRAKVDVGNTVITVDNGDQPHGNTQDCVLIEFSHTTTGGFFTVQYYPRIINDHENSVI